MNSINTPKAYHHKKDTSGMEIHDHAYRSENISIPLAKRKLINLLNGLF